MQPQSGTVGHYSFAGTCASASSRSWPASRLGNLVQMVRASMSTPSAAIYFAPSFNPRSPARRCSCLTCRGRVRDPRLPSCARSAAWIIGKIADRQRRARHTSLVISGADDVRRLAAHRRRLPTYDKIRRLRSRPLLLVVRAPGPGDVGRLANTAPGLRPYLRPGLALRGPWPRLLLASVPVRPALIGGQLRGGARDLPDAPAVARAGTELRRPTAGACPSWSAPSPP